MLTDGCSPRASAGCLVRGVLATHGRRGRVVIGAAGQRAATAIATAIATAVATAVAEVLLAQSSKTPPLGDGVDVGADDEGYQVEERHPGVLWEEFLGKGQTDRASNPGHPHDLPKSDADRGADLVVRPGTSDPRHGGQIDRVLDGSHLWLTC